MNSTELKKDINLVIKDTEKTDAVLALLGEYLSSHKKAPPEHWASSSKDEALISLVLTDPVDWKVNIMIPIEELGIF
jgi:hypothetical protein